MLQRPALRSAIVIAMLIDGLARVVMAAPVAGDRGLNAADQERLTRAVDVASRRCDEWLGPSSADTPPIRLSRAYWPAPSSMDLESQAAFQIARARFSRVEHADRLLNGIAWHLQSRIVEELFDYASHQPGHHADEVRLFGDHVRWAAPLLTLQRRARDGRAPDDVSQAAAAIATLEGVVGWPALAAALRVVASDPSPRIDGAVVRARLEAALGVPLDWFDAALEPGFTVNFALRSVATEPADCDGSPCRRTVLAVTREGQPLLPVRVLVEFGGGQRSDLIWDGRDASAQLTFDSTIPPSAVTLDPDRRIALDANPLDQRWLAERSAHQRPVRFLASWLVWLQNAVLTASVLL